MSKKSGFFYAMFALMASMFMSHSYNAGGNSSKYQPSAPTGGGGGTGKRITSYGRKPSYYKDKVLYQNQGNVIYVSVGHLYWATRALAEANR